MRLPLLVTAVLSIVVCVCAAPVAGASVLTSDGAGTLTLTSLDGESNAIPLEPIEGALLINDPNSGVEIDASAAAVGCVPNPVPFEPVTCPTGAVFTRLVVRLGNDGSSTQVKGPMPVDLEVRVDGVQSTFIMHAAALLGHRIDLYATRAHEYAVKLVSTNAKVPFAFTLSNGELRTSAWTGHAPGVERLFGEATDLADDIRLDAFTGDVDIDLGDGADRVSLAGVLGRPAEFVCGKHVDRVTLTFGALADTVHAWPSRIDRGRANVASLVSCEQVTLLSGGGNDSVFAHRPGVTANAGAGNDSMVGSAFADVFNGGAGDDRLVGNAGNDSLFGGPGRDTTDGGPGTDVERP